MSKEVLNKNKYCDICGKNKAIDVHHLMPGTSERKICEQYKDVMCLEICRQCHDFIHQNDTAVKLSKMLGQALFEVNYSYAEYMAKFKKNYLP